MKKCEKGIAVGIVVAVVAVVVVAAAVGGYLVLSHGGTGGTGATSGTGATVTTGGTSTNSKFDFSTGSTVSGDTYDFAIEPWWDQYGGSGPTPAVQSYNYNDNLVSDQGPATLASVTSAPVSGYYSDVPASNGHTFVVICHNGNYAKFHITSITYTDEENYPATITFDWAYQPDGSLNF